MRKWTYLVAALLLMGTATTFTGCIDNDEPAGIENLRGAKAELLRAKCAVEAANAALLNAKAEYQKALAAHEQANADYRKAEIEKLKLENELKSAQNAEEKARLEKQIAGYKQDMENAALTHQKTMVDLQKGLAESNRNYELALKQIEIAKATMSDTDKVKIKDLQDEVKDIKRLLDTAAKTVYQKEKDLYDAMMTAISGEKDPNGNVINWIPQLELKLKREEGKLVANEEAVTKLKEFVSKDVTTTDWRKEVATLEESIKALQPKLSGLDVQLTKLTTSDEYKAANKAANDAKAALNGITTSEYKYTYKFKATDYAYGRNEFAVANKTAIKPEEAGGAEAVVKDELTGVKAQLATYTTERVAMLEELAKNGAKDVEAAKKSYTTAVAAWKTAFDKDAKVGDYKQADAKTAIAAAGVVYNTAVTAPGADDAKKNTAGVAYAKALTTYYADANKYVGCVTNKVKLNLSLGGVSLGEQEKTISAWLSDESLSGVALAAILNVKGWNHTGLHTVGLAISTLGDASSLRTELVAASRAAFGIGCLSNLPTENSYMRVEPTKAEVLAAIKANGGSNNCGATGTYYQKEQMIASNEQTNYKEVMADFQAAITSLTAKLGAMTKEVADAKADLKTKEAAFKVFTDKEEALNTERGIVNSKKTALEDVKDALVKAISDNLGLDGVTFENTEDFEKALQGAVEKAEDNVITSQQNVAKAKVDLQKAKEGKYNGVAEAQKDLDEATAALGVEQAKYETALANLQIGLEIMAGTAK